MSRTRPTIPAALGLMALASVAATAHVPAAFAAQEMDYTRAAFAAAQADGRPILVEFTTPWCVPCKLQEPILERLILQPKFLDLMVMEVDFDGQRAIARELNVREEGTLVVFRGFDELGRLAGDVDGGSIEALLDKTL